ncbi:MAG: S8 family serine peptidase, partial [Ardenticatenaceae bacterium]
LTRPEAGNQTLESAVGTATVLVATALPDADLDVAIEEARDYLDRNPKLTTALNQLLVVFEEEGKDAALALASEKEMIDQEGYLLVILELDIDGDTPEEQNTIQALVTELESKGVLVDGTLFNEVTVRVPVEKVIAQAETEGVESLLDGLSQLEHVQHVRLPAPIFGNGDDVLGEGVGVTSANEWHEAGFRGQGVKVGVIDLGFGGYEELLGQGLPESVEVEPRYFNRLFGEEVHGTAVAEIVHEMAPEAELYFAIIQDSQSLHDAAQWMVRNGVQVINYSVGSSYGPFDGRSIDSKIVDMIAEEELLWVNAAGNEAESHWSGRFQDKDGDGWLEFGSDKELLLFAGDSIILNWWAGNQDVDYDLCVFDQFGEMLECSEDVQGAGSRIDPVEGLRLRLNQYYAGIKLYGQDTDSSPLKLFVHGEIDSDYQVAEQSLGNPADANGALTVGAVIWENDELASYSSQGPTADGRQKPELSAPTHVRNASYSEDFEGFTGTSAAAPHVAGAAALVLSAFPDMSRDELAEYLISQTTDLGPNGYDLGYGEGRLALGTAPEGSAPPPPAPPTPTPPVAALTFSDDFSDPNSGLPPQAADEGWRSGYENGKYVMTAEFFPLGTSWELYEGLDLGDFTLNVEAQHVDGSGFYGIVFRVRDNQNYYIFQLTDSGEATLRRVVNGSSQSISGLQDATVYNDQPNQITIDARGRQISVSINGEAFHTVDNDRIGHGTIGFIVTNLGFPITAEFDNLTIAP